MSSAASWSYTAKATLWPLLALDGWSGGATFGAPEEFACDYKSDARTRKNDAGEEFTSTHVLYTERSDIKRGDFVLIGTSVETDPTRTAGAEKVMHVGRYADTFERKADDFEIVT